MSSTKVHAIHELIRCFSTVPDFRKAKGRRYSLSELLAVSILALLCGANDFTAMANFCKSKENFLRRFFKFSAKSLPSHDQFRWIYSRITSEQLQDSFNQWTDIFSQLTDGELIPIDGKVIRGTRDASSLKSALCMVSAWANTNGVSLGQVKVDKKSNEKTAIPILLEQLDIEGTVVSIDAMGTHPSIAQQIVDQKADYILALKKTTKISS